MFLCTHNSARSQTAEAFLRKIAGDRFEVYNTGFEPTELNPFARMVMGEIGFDTSSHHSKALKQFLGGMHFGHLITVCQRNEEECAIFRGSSIRLDRPFEDPAAFNGNEDDELNKFREIRDQIALQTESRLKEAP
jgi:arsenate reductase (thioredoxin)